MGCFAVQKAKKKLGEQPPRQSEAGDVESEESTSPSSSPASPKKPTPSQLPSFRRTVRAIQNAHWFINHSNSKLRSSHPSYGTREHRSSAEQGTALIDAGTFGKPMPLPSPSISPPPTGYALPHPSDQTHTIPTSLTPLLKNSSAGHVVLTSRVFPWDLQPLPPLKSSFTVPIGLKSFTFEELETACQQFSQQTLIGDDGYCFSGAIRTSGKGAKRQQQVEVVVLRLHKELHLGLKEGLSEICKANHPPSSHVCSLLGFYDEDDTQERILVYEKLQKGSLHTILFGASNAPPLDWPARMKVIYDALQGLANLEERFPEQILYRDFRLSHIQVDGENNAKISGYWFVTCSTQNVQVHVLSNSSNARDTAYCAPETRSRGMLTWKSTVWSFGVVVLELLCGRKNKGNRRGKDEKHNLVKWARPFLLEENKLFLIMDQKLQGRFPAKGAKAMANLILQCLQKDPTRRPSMNLALDMMKATKETKHPGVSPRKECLPDRVVPASAPLPSSAPSEPLNPGILDRNTISHTRSPTRFDVIQSPVLKPLIIPSRTFMD